MTKLNDCVNCSCNTCSLKSTADCEASKELSPCGHCFVFDDKENHSDDADYFYEVRSACPGYKEECL